MAAFGTAAGARRTFKTYGPGDDVAGVLAIAPGEHVVGIAAWVAAGVNNGSVQIGAAAARPIPLGGALEIVPPYDAAAGGSLVGALNITFLNHAGFLVSVVS